jgi:hypothetical protein
MRPPPRVTIHYVPTDGMSTLTLEEFRLRAAGDAGEVARRVASFPSGIEPAVPLLVSIDDPRDVATVRALHPGEPADGAPGQRAALDPLVASWRPPKRYRPRIAEHSDSPPSSYRLAVTESGINDAASDPLAAIPSGPRDDGTSTPLGLMWIGVPQGTHAGLLILLGNYDDDPAVRGESSDWPLPLSGDLGVRIYQSGRII